MGIRVRWLLCFVLVSMFFSTLAVNAAAAAPKPPQVVSIAMVDTGVDIEHTDLKDYLISGTNLVQLGKQPVDDNGHGTNVAGVIIATALKASIASGVIWKPQIMPIKALDVEGTGDEEHLGRGINYAVEHGARIVILSLGLNKFSTYLSEVVQKAEAQGVLLIAASGNEGHAVKYPAAYSTVFAVGGVNPSNIVEESSNFGSELDLVAPWKVYTTAKGGGYENQEGTSMAAPQVAAVCALLWSKYPNMKPSQIRNMIRQTAQDIGPKGWDVHSGYGLLRADRALKEKPLDDIYEPNNRPENAQTLPIGKQSNAVISNNKDIDWFTVDAPYNGSLQVEIHTDSPDLAAIEMTHYKKINQAGTVYKDSLSKSVSFQVSKGRNYLRFRSLNSSAHTPIKYEIYPQFFVNPDAFEDNDHKFKAFVLPARSQKITGTFHQNSDQDWFMLPITQAGTLKLKVTTDTSRIDAVLRVEKTGEKSLLIDQKSDGEPETSLPIEVTPGNYYFLISNVKDYIFPIVGEYTFEIDYTKHVVDPNEPNDRAFQATGMQTGIIYDGVLDQNTDIDWFSFTVEEESLVQLELSNIPLNRKILAALDNYALKPITSSENSIGQSQSNMVLKLQPGKYYLELSAEESFQNQLYHLKVDVSPIVSGYSDISKHWAKDSIVKLTELDIIQGYGSYRFAPNQPISRAEAVNILNKVFNWQTQDSTPYNDVVKSDWYYSAIANASNSGVVSGYQDHSFKPNRTLSRMEMAALLTHAKTGQVIPDGAASFKDIQANYWGSSILKWMQTKGWITGYTDGSFLPERQATRAEFTQLLVTMMYS